MLRVNPQLENAVSQIQSDHRELACVITAASYASEAGGWPSLQLLTEPLNHDADQQLGDPRSEKRGPSSSLSTIRLQGTPRNRELSVSILVCLAIQLASGTISALSSWYGQPCTGRQMFNSLMMLAVEANGVVALRMMKLMLGGRKARREAELMVRKRYMRASKLPQI